MRMSLWRAVDDEGEILDMTMRPYRDAWTATNFLANLITGQPNFPERIVTDEPEHRPRLARCSAFAACLTPARVA